MRIDWLSLTFTEWENHLRELGFPSYRAKQIRTWIFDQQVLDFSLMNNLPLDLREKLINNFSLQALQIQNKQLSTDGTQKWLFRTTDGHFIESVHIPSEHRHSICISSQVGCGMGCRFCSTAKMGLIRSLTIGEILGQVLTVQKELSERSIKLTNVIFMGMGEPLQNLENVATACDILMDQKCLSIASRKITVSTSGLVSQIKKWAERQPRVKLAISLNGATNDVRSDLMPINKSYPIETLLETIDYYIDITGQTPTFEFVLIAGKTCNLESAKILRKLASPRKVKINLIPYNGGGDSDLISPTEDEIEAFRRSLSEGAFPVMIRQPRGRDIAAACGQLVHLEKKVA